MSKVSRIALAALVSLAVIVGIFTSVEGASLSARQDKAGAHLVSGAMVNLDHYREAAPAPASSSPFQSELPPGAGNGCEHDSHPSSED